MTGTTSQIVTLRRADRAADLWPAVEAAQYGHIVQPDEAIASEGAALLDSFLTAFVNIVEEWEGTAEAQAGLMLRLDAELSALTRAGWCVHWAVLQRTVSPPGGEPVEIPVAVLHIGPHPDDAVEMALPRQMTASGEPPHRD